MDYTIMEHYFFCYHRELFEQLFESRNELQPQVFTQGKIYAGLYRCPYKQT